MIILKTPEEIEKISDACLLVAETLDEIKAVVIPGITTADLEKIAEEKIKRKGGIPAFKGYRGYPSSICTSVNDQVVHGIPSRLRLEKGDIISIDIGVFLDGFYGDGAFTLPVGLVSPVAERLIRVTEEALYVGIDNARAGNRVSDISASIQRHVEANGFSVVRSFVGHGIGTSLHEEPQVPNFGSAGQGIRLKDGMTIAIEPMVNTGTSNVRILDDGWTAVTADGGLSAHFEHTIAIKGSSARILTKIDKKNYNVKLNV